MVKLVATDMDGTLLDADSRVPEGTYDLILRLRDAGIRFAASSGRRYDTLCEFFAPIKDEIDFVASNGAQVYIGGALADRETFGFASLRRLQKLVDMFDNLHLVVFDATRSFLLDADASYMREMDKDLPNAVQVDSLPSPDVNIVKVSVYCDDDPMDMAYVMARELEDDFVFAPSGRQWIDVMQRGVSKATGLQQVMNVHGITADEVVAFGDSMNDYQMLRMVGCGMAMGNARYALKQVADRTIGTNAEHAVQAELERILAEVQV